MHIMCVYIYIYIYIYIYLIIRKIIERRRLLNCYLTWKQSGNTRPISPLRHIPLLEGNTCYFKVRAMGFPERLVAGGCHVFQISCVNRMIVAANWNFFVVCKDIEFEVQQVLRRTFSAFRPTPVVGCIVRLPGTVDSNTLQRAPVQVHRPWTPYPTRRSWRTVH